MKVVLFFLAFVLSAGCRAGVEGDPIASPSPPISSTPTLVEPTPTVTPTPKVERTLVVCLGQEPPTLYPYGTASLAKESVLQAIYDGPIDSSSYEYQPVILESLPSLENGGARLDTVEVAQGESVVAADGLVAPLFAGVKVRPSGCSADDCILTYPGEGTVLMDQLVAEFRLIPGLTWSDGTPLTTSDSVYSFDLAAHPDTPTSKFVVERTASYEALDERTVQWAGLPGFIDPTYFLNFWTPYPEHVWGQLSPSELVSAELSAQAPLGWGPYVIEEWVPGERIRLVRNERYFRAVQGLPAFDNLIYRFVGQNPETSLDMLLSGECDILDQTAQLEAQGERLLELDEAGQIQGVVVAGPVWEHADFGIVPISYDNGWQASDRPDFFGDVRSRQAIAYCMDRQSVVDQILYGQSVVPDTYVSSDHPLFASDAAQYPFDVAIGSALLDEMGWVDPDGDPATPRIYQGVDPRILAGTPLVVNYWATEASQRSQAAEILAESMAQCGIQADVKVWSAEELYASGPEGPLFGRQFDIGQLAWQTGIQPPCHLFLSRAIPGDPVAVDEAGQSRYQYGWGGWNASGYANPAYDAACETARRSLPEQVVHEEMHREAQRIFAADLPAVPLYLHLRMAATRPDLCGFRLDASAVSEMWNLEEFDYGSGCGE